MKTALHPHEVFLQEIQDEFAEILTNSAQGIYMYLDDPHWICNDRLATMLDYSSAAELQEHASGSPFLDALVESDSQERVVAAYTKAVDHKVASSLPVTWKRKGGGTIKTQAIFAPISFKGTVLTLHFVTPV